jgi:hypothetical protein
LKSHHIEQFIDGFRDFERLRDSAELAIFDGVPILHVFDLKYHLFALVLGLNHLASGLFDARDSFQTDFFLDLLYALQDLTDGKAQLLMESIAQHALQLGSGLDLLI